MRISHTGDEEYIYVRISDTGINEHQDVLYHGMFYSWGSAIVLRGGRNRPDDIRRGIGTHPSGITGISVECGEEISVQGLRLNCVGSIEDLAHQRAGLRNGQSLTLYSEDLEVDGVVEFSEEEKIWVAVIDWNQIREVEELALQASA
jgi:hypothetical protein